MWRRDLRGWCGEGVDEVVQFVPHGRTEVVLLSDHCLADCHLRLPVFFCFTVHCLPVSRSLVEAWDKCGTRPPWRKWPFSQPRRLFLSATHSHLVPLLFSSTKHFILAGSLPSVVCWQALFDSNVMQADRLKPIFWFVVCVLMNYVQMDKFHNFMAYNNGVAHCSWCIRDIRGKIDNILYIVPLIIYRKRKKAFSSRYETERTKGDWD